MKLLLTVALTWALLLTAEPLRCHECVDSSCSNTTSVKCPPKSTICQTITSIYLNNTFSERLVRKNCSTPQSCFTPASVETEWSVNLRFSREAHTQICCVTDNCNFQTLAVPCRFPNGKVCPACASSTNQKAGPCNIAMACEGVEDSCFNGTVSSKVKYRGCISRNVCAIKAFGGLLGKDITITCGAPWSVGISAALLTAALPAHTVLF